MIAPGSRDGDKVNRQDDFTKTVSLDVVCTAACGTQNTATKTEMSADYISSHVLNCSESV